MYRFFLLAGPLSARHERAESSPWTPWGRAAGPTIASGAQPVIHKPEAHWPPKTFFAFFSELKIFLFVAALQWRRDFACCAAARAQGRAQRAPRAAPRTVRAPCHAAAPSGGRGGRREGELGLHYWNVSKLRS